MCKYNGFLPYIVFLMLRLVHTVRRRKRILKLHLGLNYCIARLEST